MLRILVLVSLLAFTFGQDQAELEAICKSNTGGNKFLSVPSNCTKWVACAGTQPVNNGICPDRRHFNFVKQQCDFIGCHETIPSFICPANQYPKSFQAHETDCTKYYSCQFGFIKEETCTTGNFDGISACKTTALCNTTVCLGKGLVDLELVVNPFDCKRRYVCMNETVMDVEDIACDEGLFFDVEFQECYDCFGANCKLTGATLTGNTAGSQCTQS